MALTTDEQGFLDFALAALPSWMRADDEHLNGSAKQFGAVKAQIDYWFEQTLITHATGATATQPDWLAQHMRDRGTTRQPNEGDPAGRQRIRNVPDALTRDSLLAAANAILAAEGIAGSAAMVELPRDGAALGVYSSDTGTGGTFSADTGTRMIFTPTDRFAAPPWRDPSVVRKIQAFNIVIAGAASGGNDGTFPTLGMSGNGVIIDNAAGVAGADAGATWTVQKLDRRGNVRDGFGRAYFGRGYRLSGVRPCIVLMLPFGSTASTEASVREMLRQKKAGGFAYRVERRLIP